MGTRTGVIRFNVRERGRQFRGNDRNFDTAALATLINGGDVQERVSQGDMLGYYGHWPRVKFGMDVSEGGIVAGKPVSLEPALRTVSIKAFPDGMIEHEAEFLDTASGKLAERLYRSKAGGFSSAIVAPRIGKSQVPRSFHGFDYVLEPNYTANRGYALDGVNEEDLSDEECAILDEVGQYNSLLDSTNRILDRIQSDYDRLEATAERLLEENVQMQSMLARKGAASTEVALDGVLDVVSHPVRSRFDAADEFHDAALAGYEPEKSSEPAPVRTAADNHLTKRFGI